MFRDWVPSAHPAGKGGEPAGGLTWSFSLPNFLMACTHSLCRACAVFMALENSLPGQCTHPQLTHGHRSTWLHKADTIVAHIPSKPCCHLDSDTSLLRAHGDLCKAGVGEAVWSGPTAQLPVPPAAQKGRTRENAHLQRLHGQRRGGTTRYLKFKTE